MQNSNKNNEVIKYALSLTKMRIRLADFLSAFFMLINVVLILVLVGIVFDHSVEGGLSESARAIMRYSIIGGSVIMLIAMILIPLFKKLNNLYVARAIEKANPQIRNDLTTALQIESDKNIDDHSKQAILRVVGKETKEAKFDKTVNYKALQIASCFMCVLVVAFAFYAAISDKSIWDSFLRTVSSANIQNPTVVKIVKISPQDNEIFQVGSKIEFSATVEEYDNDFAMLEVTTQNGMQKPRVVTKKMKLIKRSDEEYGKTFEASYTPLSSSEKVSFQIIAGDAKSKTCHLKIVPELSIKKISVTQKWPAYTGGNTITQNKGRIVAPKKSELKLVCQANQKIKSAQLVLEPTKYIIPAKIVNNKILVDFAVSKAGKYYIQMTSEDTDKTLKSPSYDIEIIPDNSPAINLQVEEKNIELPVNKSFHLRAEVTDDFGIDSVHIRQNRIGEIKRKCLIKNKPIGKRTSLINQKITGHELGKPGDIVLVRLYANDFCPHNSKPSRLKENLKGNFAISEQLKIKILPADENAKNNFQENKNNNSQESNSANSDQENQSESPANLDPNNPKSENGNSSSDGKTRTKDADDVNSNKGNPQQKQAPNEPKHKTEKPKTGELGDMLGASEDDVKKLDTLERNLNKPNAEKDPAPENTHKQGKPDGSKQPGSNAKDKGAKQTQKNLANKSGKGDQNKNQGNKDNRVNHKNNKRDADQNKNNGQEEGGNKKRQPADTASNTDADKKGASEKTKSANDKKQVTSNNDQAKNNQQSKQANQTREGKSETASKKVDQKNQPAQRQKNSDSNQKKNVKLGQGQPKPDNAGVKNGQPKPKNSDGSKPSSSKVGKKHRKDKDGKLPSKNGQCNKSGGNKSQKTGQSKASKNGSAKGNGKPKESNSGQASKSKEGNAQGGQQTKNANAKKSDNPNNQSDSKGAGQEKKDFDSQGDVASKDAAETNLKAEQYLNQLESIGRALTKAKDKIDAGDVDQQLLNKMKMSKAEFRAFVKEYTQRVKLAKQKVKAQQRKLKDRIEMVGIKKVLKSQDKKAGSGQAVKINDATKKSTDRKAVQDRSKKVSPEYEDLLRAFLKGTAEGK